MLNIQDLLKKVQNKYIHEILKVVTKVSKEEDKSAYVVGGFVRDLIMEEELNDIDIMVVGDGIDFAKKIAFERTVICFRLWFVLKWNLISFQQSTIVIPTSNEEQVQKSRRL